MTKTSKTSLIVLVVALVNACDAKDVKSPEKTSVALSSEQQAKRADMATVLHGGKLYAQHCAGCHGKLAQGHPNWSQRGPDGRFPAPPLNGTGHTWHHPWKQLRNTIKNGTQKLGGSMPPWGAVLSDKDIDAIISWFQAHWPEEIYNAWSEVDKKAK